MQLTPKSLVRLVFDCDFDYGYDHGFGCGCDCGRDLYLDLDGACLIADGHRHYGNLLTDIRSFRDVVYASWARRYHVNPNRRRVILCASHWKSSEIVASSMVVRHNYRHLSDLVWGVVQ
jgi:hypothetical protein